jgi:signal transduction histidine kinase
LSSAIAGKRREHEVILLGNTSPWALVDGNGLEQAVAHLLQNAIDASPPTEPVVVRVSEENGAAYITIADKGCGMDGDFVRNRLFQPFASTKPGGFGIGSFEARSLITAMGGRLSVESRLGHGTTFTIELPAAEAPALEVRKIA